MYRLSMLDLVAEGSSWEEVEELAKRIEEAGANVINTGIGWHEARNPTTLHHGAKRRICLCYKKLMGKVKFL